MAREEITLDTELLLMSFTLEFLLSCNGHRFGGALRNLSIWCDSEQNKDHWGFISADFRLGREPRGGVNSGLCLFHDWINVCYFLFTENSTWPALAVLKWIRTVLSTVL